MLILTITYSNCFSLKDLKAFKKLTVAEWTTIEIEGLHAQVESSIRRISDLHLSLNQLKQIHELELNEKSDQVEGK